MSHVEASVFSVGRGEKNTKNAPILKDSEKKTKGKRAKETPEGETDVRAEGPQGESG